jgi:hypothetical protein
VKIAYYTILKSKNYKMSEKNKMSKYEIGIFDKRINNYLFENNKCKDNYLFENNKCKDNYLFEFVPRIKDYPLNKVIIRGELIILRKYRNVIWVKNTRLNTYTRYVFDNHIKMYIKYKIRNLIKNIKIYDM